MPRITVKSFTETIDSLIKASPKNNAKGDRLKEWFSTNFQCDARVSHTTEDRALGNRVSEQFRHKAAVVVFVCKPGLNLETLVAQIKKNLYPELEAVLVMTAAKPYKYNHLYVNKRNEFVDWAEKKLKITPEAISASISASSLVQAPLSISGIISAIQSTGLIYSSEIIKRLCFSLLTKRFVILSGLAGSGKTQLALALAHSLCENREEQMCFVPVGADWTNREPLLGYPNAINKEEYVLPENGTLELLLRAQKIENQNKPYFLILDEMNLSVVERYFADFLSAMEAKNEAIKLWSKEKDDVTKTVSLGKNVFIIGTINVDETTYMFSPKVLDRANVIEFKITADEMDKYLTAIPNPDITKADGKAATFAKDFVSPHDPANNPDIKDILNSFFVELKKANAEFGYRSAHEISKFIGIALENDDTANRFSLESATDAAIVQKLLPKLHGSKKKLTPILNEMWGFCFTKPTDGGKITALEDATDSDAAGAKYPLSADKILRMFNWVRDNGFASFSEA